MRAAQRTATFTESVIREMTRVANKYDAVNLVAGLPGLSDAGAHEGRRLRGHPRRREPVRRHLGRPPLRLAIAEKYRRWYGMTVDTEREITVTCGATEAMASVFLALVDPGDEVIVFEPFYENYGPDAILARRGAGLRTLERPGLDARSRRGCAPHSATARRRSSSTRRTTRPVKVFTRAEMDLIAELCIKHDAWAITDEIYEHIRYAGDHHVLATWPGMRERTITISGLSKTYCRARAGGRATPSRPPSRRAPFARCTIS